MLHVEALRQRCGPKSIFSQQQGPPQLVGHPSQTEEVRQQSWGQPSLVQRIHRSRGQRCPSLKWSHYHCLSLPHIRQVTKAAASEQLAADKKFRTSRQQEQQSTRWVEEHPDEAQQIPHGIPRAGGGIWCWDLRWGARLGVATGDEETLASKKYVWRLHESKHHWPLERFSHEEDDREEVWDQRWNE